MALIISPAYAAEGGGVSAHDFTFTSLDGNDMPLKDFAGKVVLVVNTASKCGFTPQYEALESLYQQYKEDGFVIIGVPCNNFGGQEPENEDAVRAFVEEKYKVSFPLTSKTAVKGDDAHPFFKWAGEKAGFIGRPKWNFHKYLIGRNGEFITWFSSMTSPESSKIADAVKDALTIQQAEKQ